MANGEWDSMISREDGQVTSISNAIQWAIVPIGVKKALAIILVIVVFASMIPLFALSFYNRPYADDYGFGHDTRIAWQQSGNLAKVFGSAVQEAGESYVEWQGTFSATFLFSLQPGIFFENYYYIATFMLLGSLIVATFYFLHRVIVVLMQQDAWTWLIVSAVVLYLSVHYLPSPQEGYYWYNGGVFYTFYYALYLMLLSSILTVSRVEGKVNKVLKAVWIAFLSFFIGGGNYVTALLTVLTLALVCAVFTVKKMKNSWIDWMALLISLGALAVNAVAPGNAVRAMALEADGIRRLTLFATVLSSFKQAVFYILEWTNIQVACILLLLLPLMVDAAKKVRFTFQYPLIVLTGLYCLLSAQFSPPTMMNVSGSGRVLNIYYYFYVLSALICEFYCVGWLLRKLESVKKETAYAIKPLHRRLIAVLAAAVLLLLAVDAGYKGFAGLTALKDLQNGTARQFAKERDERVVIYLDPSVEHAVVKPLTARPALFSESELQGPAYWVNQSVASFYQKQSVSLEK